MRSLPEIFFFAIVFYVLYRFIFNFVVPIARTTRQVRQQFRSMQEMHEQQAAQGGYYQGAQNASTDGQMSGNPGGASAGGRKPNSDKVGEYIDFEEVK